MVENVTDTLHAEVVYALAGETTVIPVVVKRGTKISEAIEISGIQQMHSDINLDNQKVGVFNHVKSLQEQVCDGDRIEIYRCLISDPRETRRKRAAGKSQN